MTEHGVAAIGPIPPMPYVAPPVWAEPGPKVGRFAHSMVMNQPEMLEDARLCEAVGKCSVALIGLADDLGVELNGGRIGASQGPNAFRSALARYGVADPAGWEWPRVFDVGNVMPSPGDDAAALDETHRRVTETVRSVLEFSRGRLFPIAVGGGHDLTYPFARGVIEYWSSRGVKIESAVYFDAHLDVRETAGSGMPFRRLVETCGITRLAVFGASAMANDRDHVRWFEEHGGVYAEQWKLTGPSVASFDLDVLDASHAPGVSAMNPAGWSVVEAAEIVEAAGRSSQVRCFDIMELNPAHDERGRTARAAAHLFLAFLRGLSARGSA